MKVYIAASVFAAHVAFRCSRELEDAGITCTSRWILQENLGKLKLQEEFAKAACADLEDIDRADAVIVLTDIASSTGGLCVEMGYAIGKSKIVFLVGPRRNPFDYQVVHKETFAEVVNALKNTMSSMCYEYAPNLVQKEASTEHQPTGAENSARATPDPPVPGFNGANSRQVGGTHYAASNGGSGLQHWDWVSEQKMDYFQGQITKYVWRWKKKGGLYDLQKAQHYLEKYMEVWRQYAPAELLEQPVK